MIVACTDVRGAGVVRQARLLPGAHLPQLAGRQRAGRHRGRRVHPQWGIHTVVGRTDECSSICVAIFAAGSHQVAFPTSQIGVHSASYLDAYTGQDGEALETTLLIARYMKELGTPDAVITKMIMTPGNDISWIEADDWPTVEVIEAESDGLRGSG